MATFNYTVDTNPMANEISSVSRHVMGTTTAVVAMQTAVVQAEAKAADHVCDNVNRGFYTLIRSQISQKIAKLRSEVDSHLMQLNAQQKQLLSVKGRMEHDYNMISRRYLKLFNGLNQNLRHRVFELDRPTIDFAVYQTEKVSNRTKYLPATVPVSQLESLTRSQQIIASNVKYRGMKVIDSMTNFLTNVAMQKKLTDKILLKTRNRAGNSAISIPVIISETNFDRFDNKTLDVVVSRAELNGQTRSAVKNAVNLNIENLHWHEPSRIDKEVESQFSHMLNDSSLSVRAKEMADKLFRASNFQTVKNELS